MQWGKKFRAQSWWDSENIFLVEHDVLMVELIVVGLWQSPVSNEKFLAYQDGRDYEQEKAAHGFVSLHVQCMVWTKSESHARCKQWLRVKMAGPSSLTNTDEVTEFGVHGEKMSLRNKLNHTRC